MSWLDILSLIGTIAFAISGALVAVSHDMDIFGVNVLAVTTACGGGLIRDLVMGQTPPAMFRNPFYVGLAAIVANLVFLLLLLHPRMPRRLGHLYEWTLFLFDTLGLAAFTVSGILLGMEAGYRGNAFLLVFLGFISGVGGGVLRDIMADQIPDIFRKHIYALTSIAGGLIMVVLTRLGAGEMISVLSGMALIVVLRCLAARFRWNLPKIKRQEP